MWSAFLKRELHIINHEKLITNGNANLSKTGILIAKLKIKVNEKLKKDSKDKPEEK